MNKTDDKLLLSYFHKGMISMYTQVDEYVPEEYMKAYLSGKGFTDNEDVLAELTEVELLKLLRNE